MSTDDDYAAAFEQVKKTEQQGKAAREQEVEQQLANTEAENRADRIALRDIVLSELNKASEAVKAKGGKIELSVGTVNDREQLPANVSFRVHGPSGKTASPVYEISARRGSIIVLQKADFEIGSRGTAISEEIGIQRRDDLTEAKVKQLILRAINESGGQSAQPRR